MRRLLPPVLLVLLLLPAGAGASLRSDAAERRASVVPHQLVVEYRAGSDRSERAAARRAAGASAVRSLRLPRTQVVRADEAGQALRRLQRDPAVAWVERVGRRYAGASADDDLLGSLWGLHNLGSSPFGGLADADIDAPEAWDVETGSSDVVVAVVDEGIAYDHPDLAGNMWSGAPNHGYDFYDDDADPYDSGGHGTHVAGTIAAQGNNAQGISGVAWDAQLMAVRVLGPDGGTDPDVAEGFDYAADNGARVVNVSLGGAGFSQVIENAMAAHPDTLFVIAAGNGGDDGVGDDNDDASVAEYPCSSELANVVCVAATNSSDQLAGFSNYGEETVDIAAPGVNILSAALSDVPFEEQFESGDLGGFTGTAEWFQDMDEYGGYAGVTHAYGPGDHTLRLTTPLTLPNGCELVYGVQYNLSTADSLEVERSTDGTTWSPLVSHGLSAADYDYYGADLPAGTNHLRFRVDSLAGSVTGNYVLLDEVAVTCSGFGENSYVLSDGTSMATPHVAGAAALLFAATPGATVAQVRHALLSSGDEKTALAGKTVSGRRLNVAKALGVVDEPIVVIGDLAASTGGATVTATTATLDGVVNAGGAATTYRFEYGTQATLGSSGPALGPVTTDGPVSGTISGLQPGTTYFYRVAAERGSESALGEMKSFTTLVEDPVATQFGDNATASCKRRRSGGRLRSVRCRANAALATKVAYRITRKGRTVALGSGVAGKRIKLTLRRRVVKRGRYRLILTFTAADGRTKVVRRRVRL